MSGCKDCAKAQNRIEDLEEQLAYIKFKLEDLQSKRYKSSRPKPPDDTPPVAPETPKKRGGLFGHIGWFRNKPNQIDRIEEVALDKCPECGSRDLTECQNTHEHIQEDIILPKVEVTLYRKHRYYCKCCKKVLTPKGSDEIPGSRISPRVKSFAAFLRYAIKISENDVTALFEKAFNLKISSSSIAGFMDHLKVEALPIYDDLLSSLKKGSFIHADETGWPLDGKNYWLWKFSNKRICFSHIDKSRGQKVVEDIIGKEYSGVLISDFLSAYNKIDSAKQRCLAHIFRDLDKVIEYWHDDKEVMSYCERLKKIFKDAIELYKEYKGRKWDDTYCRRRESLTRSLEDFSFPNPNKRILARFAKRLERHKGEMLTFLYEDGIDFHNNHAEQQIRPDVIFRKITFGNRSIIGAENHSVIMSILQTAKLSGIDSIAAIEKILLKSPQNPLAKAFSP